LDYECKFRSTRRQKKNNEYTNAHHTVVKNGKLQHFLVLSFKKYLYVIFNGQIELYYANEQ